MELTGFMTKQLSVKKAETEHIPGIIRLYKLKDDEKLKNQFTLKWQQIIEKEKDDYHNDVTFVVRSRRKKIVGLLRAKAVEKNGVEIKIWLSTLERVGKYQEHLLESVIEYYNDYQNFDYISKIEIIRRNNNHYVTDKIIGKIIL